jgi:type I restriction enzyme M protein
MLSNPPYGKSWSKDLKYIKDGKKVIDSRFLVELKDYWGNTLTEDATPRSSDGQLLFLMEMITKMKPMENSPFGSRIASVHNGSSLFTGDAGSGESNVRRYIIENDMLEAIIQLPNNIFYNTGITTYIWLLNNNKPSERQGKVQLIDASLLSQKLIKNLGDKNCEFSPQHIIDITNVYLDSAVIKRQLDKNKDPVGIASQVFDNKDFGYYKVIIERPDRRKAQFRDELIAPLRFDKALREPMEYLYLEHGEKVYQEGFLKTQEKNILAWCEENEFSLNTKNKTKLLNTKNWNKLLNNHTVANELKSVIGATEFGDFNLFKKTVESTAKCLSKTSDIKIDSSGKNAILNANSWYDENAPKVIKNTTKFKQEKLDTLLNHLNCRESDLADYGYYSTENKNEYITYETCTELKDAELIPVKDDIYHYFLKEVKPHVGESWINLDSTKIGYEINFNNYFYKQKSLRDMKLIAMEIIDLEQGAEGLIAGVLGIDVADIHGEP